LDLKQLWENQVVSTSLESLMRSWSHRVAEAITTSARGRNVTQWAKKIDCWKAVMHMAADLPLPDPPPPEFHITVTERKGWGVKPEEIRVPIDQEEIEAISTCRATDVAEWIKILDWGQRTGGLDVSQRQIISSLRLLLPGVGKRTRQEKMRGKVGESSFGHVNRVRFEETSA
jgi:hypothetical protein